jgi:hypothetical protein
MDNILERIVQRIEVTIALFPVTLNDYTGFIFVERFKTFLLVCKCYLTNFIFVICFLSLSGLELCRFTLPIQSLMCCDYLCYSAPHIPFILYLHFELMYWGDILILCNHNQNVYSFLCLCMWGFTVKSMCLWTCFKFTDL